MYCVWRGVTHQTEGLPPRQPAFKASDIGMQQLPLTSVDPTAVFTGTTVKTRCCSIVHTRAHTRTHGTHARTHARTHTTPPRNILRSADRHCES